MEMIFFFSGVTNTVATGKIIRSQNKWNWMGCSWHMELFPNGEEAGDTHCAAFLCAVGQICTFLKLSMTLKSQSDGSLDVVDKEPDSAILFDSSHGHVDNNGTSSLTTIQHLFDPKNSFVVDDFVIIAVKLGTVPYSLRKTLKSTWWSTIPDILLSDTLSDFIIEVDGASLPVHKVILGVVSPVFKAMFENQMSESSTGKLHITDFSEEIVRSFLTCLYNVEAIDHEMTSHCENLLKIANKYEVMKIVEIAELHIIETITVENAVDILKFGDLHNREKIKKAAMKIMLDNSSVAFNTPNLVETLGPILCTELFQFLACKGLKATVNDSIY
jgi:hypothetical protein